MVPAFLENEEIRIIISIAANQRNLLVTVSSPVVKHAQQWIQLFVHTQFTITNGYTN